MKKLCFLFVFLALTVNALADVPKTMNYQGRLTDISGNPVADNNYTITVQLYLDIDDDVNDYLWSENHNVDTKNGYFNVILGTISPLDLDFNNQYCIGIKVGGDQEMTPRQPLAGVPYASNSQRFEGKQIDSGSNLIYHNEEWMGNNDILCKDITFSKTFSNPPLVFCTRHTADLDVNVDMISTRLLTTSSVQILVNLSGDATSGNVIIHWMALGE